MRRAFTHNVNVRNVNEALEHGLRYLPYGGQQEDSRNGPVLVATEPVITCYSQPTERVLFSPKRDANPFFHMMEALWMLAGRDDVAYPVQFNSKFGAYSDDGERFWGAYGARWRHWFGYDQLELIITELQRNPDSRRCVLAMWSPGFITSDDERGLVQPDLMQALGGGKDVPCNTHAYFRIIMGKEGPQLDMMVCNRSNDVFWGAYGANAVHFSILQEYVASCIGVEVGRYWQNSFNFHVYLDKFPIETFGEYADSARENNHYVQGVKPYPLMQTSREVWDTDLMTFMKWSEGKPAEMPPAMADNFFVLTAVPARQAWAAFKAKDFPKAKMHAEAIFASDWRIACCEWLDRRREKNNVG